MTTQTTTVTEQQIRDLAAEALAAGDAAQHAICIRALNGSESDWIECERVIRDAQATVGA